MRVRRQADTQEGIIQAKESLVCFVQFTFRHQFPDIRDNRTTEF